MPEGGFDICLECLKITRQCWDYEHELRAQVIMKGDVILSLETGKVLA